MTRKQAEARVVAILRRVFHAGEQWGVTYSTWFTPSKEDSEREANIAISRALAALARKEKK